jgi:hypothetical protein
LRERARAAGAGVAGRTAGGFAFRSDSEAAAFLAEDAASFFTARAALLPAGAAAPTARVVRERATPVAGTAVLFRAAETPCFFAAGGRRAAVAFFAAAREAGKDVGALAPRTSFFCAFFLLLAIGQPV